MKRSQKIGWKWLFATVLGVIIGCICAYPIPYDVMEPGSATEIGSTVKISQHPPEKKGSFYLTTVAVREARLFDYIRGIFPSEMELVKQDRESDAENDLRQKEDMVYSQKLATIAAFRNSEKPLTYTVAGVKIIGLAKRHATGLRLGDIVKQIDQQKVTSSLSLVHYLQHKKANEKVTLHLIRGDKQVRQTTQLVYITDNKKAGIGMITQPQIHIKSNPAVQFQNSEIGGPSAGLMFSLEIVNRLKHQNLTKGKKIAGTGTIDEHGKVGQIGGIQYKILAAAEKGVKTFLCPKDLTAQDNNEKIAKFTVKKQGLSMRILPVSSLDEAVQVLEDVSK